MPENKFNPTLRAVMSIRYLVTGLQTNWTHMDQLGVDLSNMLKGAHALMSSSSSQKDLLKWQSLLGSLMKNIKALKEILDIVTEKIKQRDVSNVVTVWEQTHQYSKKNQEIILKLETTGLKSFPSDQKDSWSDLWIGIRTKISLLENYAEACNLQLGMIEKYKPNEVDEMTELILRQIPKNYSLAEADAYEKDYLKIYEDLKNEASGKKNLWDRFLDILAGGVQESPAERLMMEKWIAGEKGDL